jgi:hypothetical protein
VRVVELGVTPVVGGVRTHGKSPGVSRATDRFGAVRT